MSIKSSWKVARAGMGSANELIGKAVSFSRLALLAMFVIVAGGGIRPAMAAAAQRVQGLVSGPSNLPAASAQITLENKMTHATVTARTNAQGAFSIRSVEPGMYEITVQGSGSAPLRREFFVAPGLPAGEMLSIRLGPGTTGEKAGADKRVPGDFVARPANPISLVHPRVAASAAVSSATRPAAAGKFASNAAGVNSPAVFSIYSPVLSPNPLGFGFSEADGGGIDENQWLTDNGASAYDARLPLAATEDGTDTTFIATDANNAVGTDFYDSIVTGYFVGAKTNIYRFANNAWTLLRSDTITGYTSVPGSTAAADHTITFANSGPATKAGDVAWIAADDTLGQIPLYDVAYRGTQYPYYCLDWSTHDYPNTGGCFPLNPTAPSAYDVPLPYQIVADTPTPSDVASFPGGQFTNATSLQITTSDAKPEGIQNYTGYYSCGSGSEQFQPGHTYELGVWLKGTTSDGNVTVAYSQFPGTFYGNSGIGTVFSGVSATSWKYYTWQFPAPGCVPDGHPSTTFNLTYNGPGTLEENGLHVYDTTYPVFSTTQPVIPAVQQAWNDYKPSVMRLWSGFSDTAGGYQYWSLDSWLDPEWQGRTSPEIGNFYTTDQIALHLPQSLEVTKQAGANPWLIVQMSYSPQEWSDLMDYLASPAGSTPYSLKRPASHPGPYTDDFQTIYLEVGNEEWGTQETPVNFAYGQWVQFVATAATTGKSYATQAELLSKFKFITNGFFLQPGFASGAIAQAPLSTVVDYALYNSGDTNLTGNDYFQSDLVQLPSTNQPLIDAMVSQQKIDAAQGHPYTLASYESGPGADVPAHQGDTSLAAATATMDVDLYGSLRGFNPINFFLFGEGTGPYTSHTNFAGGFLPHPVWEASQMRNLYLNGDMVWTVPGSVPTVAAPGTSNSYPAVSVYAFHDANNQVDVAIISRDFYNTTPVTLNFPGTPVGTANYYYLAPPQGGDPSATNDAGLNVPINSQVLSGVTQSYTINVAPGSFNILQVPISGSWSTQVPAPAAPVSLTAHAENGSVALGWQTVDGATSYNILRGTVAGGESATPVGTTTGAGYVDTGVTNGTKYYYVVTASNVGGTSGPSNEVSATPNLATAAMTTPPLDGSDSGAWAAAPSYPLSHDFNTFTPDTASYKVLWDTTYLYVLATVQDSTIVAPNSSNIFTGDSVEVYFSGTDTSGSTYGPTDFQYAFPYGNAGAVPTESHHNAVAGVIEGQQNIPGGYQLAIAIPWATLGTAPVAGKQYGFDVMVNDATSQGVRDGKLAWWATVDQTYFNPSLMGPLVLSPNGLLPATNTRLSVSPTGPLNVDELLSLTATVSPSSGSKVPTGSVTFNVTGASSSRVTAKLDSNGNATATLTLPKSGTYSITASYGGSASFASSVSAPQSETVGGLATETTIAVAPGASLVYDQPWTITATVTAPSGQVIGAGTVTFTIGTRTKVVKVDATGTAIYSGAAPTPGTYTVKAAYSGTSSFAASASAPVSVSVAAAPTTTVFAITPSTGLAYGAPWTLTAKVTSAYGTPTGKVTFNVVGPYSQSAVVSLDKTGTGTYVGTAPRDGTYAITATFEGSTNYGSSVSAAASETIAGVVTQDKVTLTQTPSTNLIAGQPWTLTAFVKPASGAAIPTGTVTFKWTGGTSMVSLDSTGNATYTGIVPPVGPQSVVAKYSGSSAFHPNNSNTLVFTVLGSPTTTTLAISPNGNVVTGQPLTLTAQVAVSSGTAVPTGSVSFALGSDTASVKLDSTGKAVYTTTAPAPGSYSASASYGGSSTLAGSVSSTVNETVTGAPTTTTLTVTPPATVVSGSPWTLTAVVAPSVGSAVPTGSVNFAIGTATVNVPLDGTGKAVYSGSAPAAGSYALTAAYSGATAFLASASTPVSEVVTGIPTTTALSIAPGLTLASGQPVVLTATVSAAGSGTAPSGTITFTVGSASYNAPLNASGVATYNGTAPAAGTYSVAASYPGSSTFAPSSSAPASITVVAAGTAVPIAVPNYSFEQGGVGYNVPSNWNLASSSPVSGNYALQQIVGGANATPPAEDGSDYWAPSDFNQTTAPYGPTTATLTSSASLGAFQANTDYTLTVALADPADGTDPSLKSVGFQLLANGVPVQSFVSTTLVPGGGFADYSLNFYTSSNPNVVGQNITIALVYTYNGQYNRQAFFDNVRLTQTYGVSQPLTNSTTTLSVSPNNTTLVAGTPYTLKAAVTGTGTSDIPTGSVVFTIGSTTQTVALDGTGTASYAGTVPPVGNYAISAAYGGSGEFNPSNSATLSETVVAPGTPIPIPIPNYSFEQGGAGYNVPNNWNFASSGTGGDYSVQYISTATSPAAADGSDYWAPGNFNQGSTPYGSSTAALTTSASLGTFAANTTYALTVALAVPSDADSSYKSVGFELLANGVVVASLPAANLVEGANFTDVSLSFDTASAPAVVGQNITVALIYGYTGPYNRSAFFDNVRLTQVTDTAP